MSEDSSKTQETPRQRSWGPVAGVAYGFGVALLGVQIGVGVLLGLVLGLTGMTAQTISNWMGTISGQFIFTAIAEITMFAAIFFYLRRQQISIRAVGLGKIRPKHFLYVAAGTIVYFLAYFIVVSVVAALVPSLNLQQQQDIGFKNPTGFIQLGMVFISLVVLPPVAEETIFRGFMFKGLRSKLSFAVSAVITSLFFAMGHLQIGQGTPLLWVAGIDTFTLSLVLCYVREKTDSIWPTIGIHAVKNFIAFSLLYIFH